VIEQAYRGLHQTQRLAAAAPTSLRPALDSMAAAFLTEISRGPTTPTTLVAQTARLQLVGQALSRCGLSIDIFGMSVRPTAGGTDKPTTTLASATFGLCRLQTLTDAPEYVGRSLAQADALAKQHNEHVTVENRDGRAIPVPSHSELNGVMVAIQNGSVIEACRE
jgi:hypothetical protein